MRKVVTIVDCDRCDKSTIQIDSRHRFLVGGYTMEDYPEGWHNVKKENGTDEDWLCPHCAREYFAMYKRFKEDGGKKAKKAAV